MKKATVAVTSFGDDSVSSDSSSVHDKVQKVGTPNDDHANHSHKKKEFKKIIPPFEQMEQLIIISPNNKMFQTWIFLISVLGVVSSCFSIFQAAVRHDLESWFADTDIQ